MKLWYLQIKISVWLEFPEDFNLVFDPKSLMPGHMAGPASSHHTQAPLRVRKPCRAGRECGHQQEHWERPLELVLLLAAPVLAF